MTDAAHTNVAARPRVDGKFLALGDRRFLVKGITYGTFAPDASGSDVQFPAPARIAQDFGLMAAAGFNTVRTYTVPPVSLLDEAARHGLRVMTGLPWAQHIAFLDDPQLVRQIRQDAVAAVRRLASHPATLLFAVGNEIPPAIVRWHGRRRVESFLRDLYDEIKATAPQSLLTYVNFPPTEFLDVDGFDVCAFNVYLHREADLRAYLARLQHIAGCRPLLLAEAGADSVREGLDGQARITSMLVRAAFAEGACGAVAFSWTDEWWRGGHPVEDWAFGLVDAERHPKPALAAVGKAFADAPFAPDERERWPKVSVVVCAYNAADTIDDCLRSLAALTYPDVEIIVVNDGSSDATGAIARRHAGIRVLDIPNGGLSAARNVGLAEATGDIVAYTDADVRVDPDWLTYLVQPLLTREYVGAGGPNVVPQDDPLVAQCVARAPGGPVHVLLSDRVAEHVPGCNMAFRREALLAIGGFNPVYLRAGDDVDVCWRLQAKGLRIGFAPAAVVWHHHRQTIRAFYRQQVGYGECEAWLVAHHPEKFVKGQMLWRGRIYSPLPFIRSFTRSRVNTGVWGTAAFPSVYSTGARSIELIPHSPAWMVTSTALVVVGAFGLFTPSHGAGWLLLATGLLGWSITLVRCAMFARRSDLRGLPPIGKHSPRQSRFLYHVLIAWLHLVQPLARMRGRIRGVWSMPQVVAPGDATRRPWETTVPSLRDARASVLLLLGGTVERSFWSESWTAHPTLLAELAAVLRASRPALVVDLDDGWRPDRDVSLAVGSWAWLHASVLVEEHAEGRCLLRAGTRLRPSLAGMVQELALAVPLVMAASAALALRWPIVSMAAVVAAAAIVARAEWQTARVRAAFDRALERVTSDAGMLPLAVRLAAPARVRSRLPTVAEAVQAVIVAMFAGIAGLGVVSIAREGMAMRSASTLAATAAVDSEVAASGGVAVGVSGDLYVADAQQGVIQRLRPRPPMDAALTATDIGTADNPLLGNPVPFEAAADIALAPNGDLYVADARNNRVCRIERATGTIVTVAGSGRSGFAGDGGRASSATLNGPGAVALAANGDLYVADTLNNRIRVMAQATGLIRTVAGDGTAADAASVGDDGPALRAHLDRPSGLALSPNGDLYIADTGHNRVRRISARTGLIFTVAGDGTEGADGDGGPATQASLAAPMGLALVLRGQQLLIYVADSQNDRVRVIDANGGISTLSDTLPVVTPVRLAYHPAGWLYIKDASPDGITAVAVNTPLHAPVAAPAPPVARKVM
jgi:GT2 family glycosyltransferase/DNA-binding beta-propeller fold protein YncE